jgi:hypothetical protein
MLQPPELFTWVLWTPLLLSGDVPELLLTSIDLPQQPRNKKKCAKTMETLQLQQTGCAGWERSCSGGVALAGPQGCWH